MAAAASLAVRVSAQIAEFQKAFSDTNKTLDGFKKDFDKTATGVQGALQKIGGALTSFTAVAGQIGSAISGIRDAGAIIGQAFDVAQRAIGAVVGVIADAVSATIDLGDQLFTLSQQSGISVENLSALKFVAGQTGTSLEAISGAAFKLEANLGKATKESQEAFKKLGLSISDLKAQDPAKALADVTQAMGEKLPNAADRAAVGMAIFGKSFKDIAQLTQEDLKGLIAQAEQFGLVMSTETAVAADMFGDAMGEIRGQLEGLALQIGAKLLPIVLTFVKVFGEAFTKAVQGVTAMLGKSGQSFDTFAKEIGEAAARVIKVLALILDAAATWTRDWALQFFTAADAVLRFSQSTIAVARVAALLAGTPMTKFFDDLSKSITESQKTIETLAKVTIVGGAAVRTFAQTVADEAGKAGEGFAAKYDAIRKEIEAAAKKMREGLGKAGGDVERILTDAEKAAKKLADSLSGQAVATDLKAWTAAIGTFAGSFTALSNKQLKQFVGMLDEANDHFGDLSKTAAALKLNPQATRDFQNLAIAIRAMVTPGKTIDLPIIPTLDTRTLAALYAKAKPPEMILEIIPEIGADTAHHIQLRAENVVDDVKSRFATLKDGLKQIATDAGQQFAATLGDAIATGDWSRVGQDLAATLGDLLGSALALAVDFVVPGLGRVLQPLFQGIGRFFTSLIPGLNRAGREMVQAFAEARGGFTQLRDDLRALDAEGDRLWRNLTQRVAAGSEAQAQAAIDAIEEAFRRADEGMKNFITGAQKRIKAFTDSFKVAGKEIADLRKQIEAEAPEDVMGITEATARKQMEEFTSGISGSLPEIQAEFQRLGLYAGTAFAETLRDKGLAAALDAAGPLFDELNTLGSEFGLTLEGSAAKFAAFFQTAKDNQDVVSALEGIELMIRGAGDAAFLTQELFHAFGEDALAQFTRLQDRGVDVNTTMALMQPTLQALWEAQQKFGFETDAATQALIDQGVQAGIVGANQKDVNEKILDVLLAIAKVFHADIPAGMEATARKAEEAGGRTRKSFEDAGQASKKAMDGVKAPPIDEDSKRRLDVMQQQYEESARRAQRALDGIRAPQINVPVRFDLEDQEFNFEFNGPRLGRGGIVSAPTLALVGEKGPEVVAPLDRIQSLGGSTTTIIELDSRVLVEAITPLLPGEVTRYGVGLT